MINKNEGGSITIKRGSLAEAALKTANSFFSGDKKITYHKNESGDMCINSTLENLAKMQKETENFFVILKEESKKQ